MEAISYKSEGIVLFVATVYHFYGGNKVNCLVHFLSNYKRHSGEDMYPRRLFLHMYTVDTYVHSKAQVYTRTQFINSTDNGLLPHRTSYTNYIHLSFFMPLRDEWRKVSR